MLKKIISVIAIVLITMLAFQLNVFATSIPLNSVTVDVSKEKVVPGEEVKVTVNFGTTLGSYTFDIAYDNNIFEYVSAEGGTPNDNGTRVKVNFYDTAGGSNPRENMSVTFRAKEELTSTNPTEFSITADGLANNDGSQLYDDITMPIKKNVTVEPNYVDYELRLEYSGNVIKQEEKTMELITESAMGRNYDHVKMNVGITKKPSDSATVNLFATERTRQEIDLVKEGWGEPDGYQLGGKDVAQILDIRGLFSEAGDYTIKISLVDKDNSDSLIVEKEFNINVQNENTENNPDGTQPPETTPPAEDDDTTQEPGDNNNNGNNNDDNNENDENTDNTNQNNTQKPNKTDEQKVPEKLPQTGNTVYAMAITAVSVLIASYVVVANFKKKK